jgi:hypothetical protein
VGDAAETADGAWPDDVQAATAAAAAAAARCGQAAFSPPTSAMMAKAEAAISLGELPHRSPVSPAHTPLLAAPVAVPVAVHPAAKDTRASASTSTSALGEWARSSAATAAATAFAAAPAFEQSGMPERVSSAGGGHGGAGRMAPGLRTQSLLQPMADAASGEAVAFGTPIVRGTEMSREMHEMHGEMHEMHEMHGEMSREMHEMHGEMSRLHVLLSEPHESHVVARSGGGGILGGSPSHQPPPLPTHEQVPPTPSNRPGISLSHQQHEWERSRSWRSAPPLVPQAASAQTPSTPFYSSTAAATATATATATAAAAAATAAATATAASTASVAAAPPSPVAVSVSRATTTASRAQGARADGTHTGIFSLDEASEKRMGGVQRYRFGHSSRASILPGGLRGGAKQGRTMRPTQTMVPPPTAPHAQRGRAGAIDGATRSYSVVQLAFTPPAGATAPDGWSSPVTMGSPSSHTPSVMTAAAGAASHVASPHHSARVPVLRSTGDSTMGAAAEEDEPRGAGRCTLYAQGEAAPAMGANRGQPPPPPSSSSTSPALHPAVRATRAPSAAPAPVKGGHGAGAGAASTRGVHAPSGTRRDADVSKPFDIEAWSEEQKAALDERIMQSRLSAKVISTGGGVRPWSASSAASRRGAHDEVDVEE